ncbi:MAG: aminoacyl-histidine dipeptidase [Clostridia bacterium]|nr:aminoacyl-histidine dipeptidase [Clostridia bacterium]
MSINVLSGLMPEKVFRYFNDISMIPRGSGNTDKISEYCCDFAKARGFEYIRDTANNVIIFKNGSSGRENEEPVILQGHLDMVCEKSAGREIDFLNDPLSLKVDGDYIYAEGTTLGGDDGIAVAYCLALLDSSDISHPPLEVVFTTDEEAGMEGAQAIDTSCLKGKRMINIDSEAEGTLWVSCAGGGRADVRAEFVPVAVSGTICEIVISGLHGGHSGTEIHKGYANANKLMGRILNEISGSVDYCLVSINGGTMDNAITRECRAKIVISSESEALFKIINRLNSSLRKEYKETDPDLNLKIIGCSAERYSASKSDTKRIVDMLCEFPNGVISMSEKIEGMVETSLNLGAVKTLNNCVNFTFLLRSSNNAERKKLTEDVLAVAEKYGATYDVHSEYPAWEYKENSVMQTVFADVYKDVFGKEMVVTAIHAGLECGLFCGKIDGLDCVSFGPDILDIHTPQEKLSISSCARMWEYLLEVLKRI